MHFHEKKISNGNFKKKSMWKNNSISKIIEIINDIALHDADYVLDNTAIAAVVVAHEVVGNILVGVHCPRNIKNIAKKVNFLGGKEFFFHFIDYCTLSARK